jgi:drug/metabolite transporter (DMT)-like permease
MVTILYQGELSKVLPHQWKWIVMRGAFGSLTALLGWVAVAVGAPVGDASALGSVNVVVAALVGSIFLGEPLGCLRILALISSVVGAFIVSRPDSGADSQLPHASTAWLGYAFALAAGCCSGGLFIASRKSQDISPLLMSFSVSFQEGVFLWAVASFGLVEDGPLAPLIASPALGTAWMSCFLVIFVITIGSMTIGAQECPALASSAIYTSMSMSLGYVAQTCVHRQDLQPIKVAGASLMLLAVVLIAAARWWQSKHVSARELEESLLAPEAEHEADVPVSSDREAGSESMARLADFIAAEFSGVQSIRQRRTLAAVAQAVVGATLA